MPAALTDESLNAQIARVVQEVIATVPSSSESTATDPKERVQELAFRAKCLAALTSGTLALPPGPYALLTVIPDLVVVWKIQAQLVADIAAAYGVRNKFNPDAMLCCLFRYGAATVARELITHVGTRIVLRRASLKVMQEALSKLGIKVTQRVLGTTATRMIPLIGAGALGAYAWYDTDQVATTTEKLCKRLVSKKRRASRKKPAKRTVRRQGRRSAK